jgi:hypothetical protein
MPSLCGGCGISYFSQQKIIKVVKNEKVYIEGIITIVDQRFHAINQNQFKMMKPSPWAAPKPKTAKIVENTDQVNTRVTASKNDIWREITPDRNLASIHSMEGYPLSRSPVEDALGVNSWKPTATSKVCHQYYIIRHLTDIVFYYRIHFR